MIKTNLEKLKLHFHADVINQKYLWLLEEDKI